MKVLSAKVAREPGFYWVMLAREWTVAQWGGRDCEWISVLGCIEMLYIDDDFEEIDERRIERSIV